MGIFSSKSKTTVGTSVTRAIENENIPDSIRSGAMKSIIRDDGQMIENSMDELIQSIGLRASRMYKFGKESYPNGLPIGTLLNSKSGEEMIKAAIEEDIGPIEIDYYHYGPLNNLHFGWIKLVEEYDYDPATNKFQINNVVWYLENMVVAIRESTMEELSNGSLDQWGIAPTAGVTPNRAYLGKVAKHSPFLVDPETLIDYIKVTGIRTNATGFNETFELQIPVTGIDPLDDYHHVRYIKDGVPGYWLYKAGDGEHPGIDKLHSSEYAEGGSYFPWVYFRYGKESTIEDKTTAEYIASKKMLNRLGMDFDTVGKAINENPDIGDVEQAMLVMAVPANSSNQMDIRYLFDYFNGMHQSYNGESKKIQDLNKLLLRLINGEKSAVVIQDKKFKMSLNWRLITKTKHVGKLGPIGTHEGGYEIAEEKTAGTTVSGTISNLISKVGSHFYRRQITDNVFEEILVEGLSMKYHIFGDHYETADENEDILLIPLDMAIVNTYSIADKELLYSRSLHYVFNSRIVTKIKWYQRGAFKFLMMIVSIVITFFNPPAGLALLAATVGVSLIVMIIIINLLVGLLISIAISLFVKLFGAKFAMLVAIAAILYGGIQAIGSGSAAGLSNAMDYVNMGNSLIAEVNKERFNDLQQEYQEFEDMVSSEKEKLEKAKAELSYNNFLSPLIVLGETPSEYYDRTVHSGNIGILAIDAVSAYYDIALSLPKLQETIGASNV